MFSEDFDSKYRLLKSFRIMNLPEPIPEGYMEFRKFATRMRLLSACISEGEAPKTIPPSENSAGLSRVMQRNVPSKFRGFQIAIRSNKYESGDGEAEEIHELLIDENMPEELQEKCYQEQSTKLRGFVFVVLTTFRSAYPSFDFYGKVAVKL